MCLLICEAFEMSVLSEETPDPEMSLLIEEAPEMSLLIEEAPEVSLLTEKAPEMSQLVPGSLVVSLPVSSCTSSVADVFHCGE